MGENISHLTELLQVLLCYADSLSYPSLTVMQHHDQGYLQREALNWGRADSFRGRVYDRHDVECGSRQIGMFMKK